MVREVDTRKCRKGWVRLDLSLSVLLSALGASMANKQ